MTAGASVRCRGVTHLYQREGEQVVALRDVDLDVAAGEAVALLGPSGCGKSTLLSLLAALQPPTTGEVVVAGRRLGADSRAGHALRSTVVGLLVQEPTRALAPFATPTQLLRLAGDHDAGATLQRYALADVARQHVATLSAGQQQRVALAVTMARRPALLLADEPTSRLDPAARDLVVNVLHEVTRERGTTVVAVTHDAAVAATFPRTVVMRSGRVGSEGLAGVEHSVVAGDGTVILHGEALQLLPPGSRFTVRTHDGDVVLRPVEGGPT
jgi:ABC-type lipoprotein export system ATPase subunit